MSSFCGCCGALFPFMRDWNTETTTDPEVLPSSDKVC